MWRCLNDVFGYCSGEPEAKAGEEVKSGDLTVIPNTCGLDPKTCGKYQKTSEAIEPAELQGESYRHTLVTPGSEATSQTPKPAKRKGKPKQEEKLF